ncbi:MAG: hypothetical protein IPP74_11860 [Alphaproteobacteria bacterium]|nr:hypothetical protein [Alphaproteobacteria bacterium]
MYRLSGAKSAMKHRQVNIGRIRHIAWQLAAVAAKRDSTRISSSRNLLWNMQNHFWTPEQIAGHLKHGQTRAKSILSRNDLPLDLSGFQTKRENLDSFRGIKAKRGLRKSKGAGASRIPNRVSSINGPAR